MVHCPRNIGTGVHLKWNLHANTTAATAWREVLGISASTSHIDVGHLISEAIAACHREFNAVEAALRDAGYPASLTERYFNNARTALSLENVNKSGDHTAQYLKEENFVSLRWASVVLPDEMVSVSSEDMAELQQLVDALKATLDKDGIPPHFRQYANNLLESLQSAIRMWPVQGSAPLKNAVRQAVSDANFDGETLQAELKATVETPEVKAVHSALTNALTKAAEVTDQVKKFAEGAGYLLSKAYDAGRFISDNLPNGGS